MNKLEKLAHILKADMIYTSAGELVSSSIERVQDISMDHGHMSCSKSMYIQDQDLFISPDVPFRFNIDIEMRKLTIELV